jgi:hypothetical protein
VSCSHFVILSILAPKWPIKDLILTCFIRRWILETKHLFSILKNYVIQITEILSGFFRKLNQLIHSKGKRLNAQDLRAGI